MTILSVDLTQQGASLSGDGDGTRQKRSYSANYIVKTDDPTTSTKAIEKHFKNSPPLPWYGRSWKWTGTAGNDSDPDSICKKFTVSHEPQSAGIFKVVAEFEPIDGDDKDKEKPSNSDSGDNSRDPLEWREQMSISYTQVTEPVMLAVFRGFTTGANGDQVIPGIAALQIGGTYIPQNSALVPYDPLPEREIDIKVIRLTKNVPEWDGNAADAWQRTVNTDLVTINKPQLKMIVRIRPLQGRLKQISATSDFQNGVAFVRREVEIWVHPNGWRGRLADMGHHALALNENEEGFVSPGDLINNPGRLEQITLKDKDDYPSTAPVPLDGFGKPLRTKDATKNVWGNWSYYREVPWAPIVKDF
jgi:hypothetical protein